MNKVILTGRLTRDVELRATQQGNFVCEFTLATNRPVVRDGERVADFVTCIVWNKQAENLAKYQSKGNLIAVEGNIRTDSYKDKDGNTRYKTYVLVNTIEYLEAKKPENASNENTSDNNASNEESNPYADFYNEHQEELDLTDELPF